MTFGDCSRILYSHNIYLHSVLSSCLDMTFLLQETTRNLQINPQWSSHSILLLSVSFPDSIRRQSVKTSWNRQAIDRVNDNRRRYGCRLYTRLLIPERRLRLEQTQSTQGERNDILASLYESRHLTSLKAAKRPRPRKVLRKSSSFRRHKRLVNSPQELFPPPVSCRTALFLAAIDSRTPAVASD